MEMTDRPQFGTIGFYEAMAAALNADADWLEKGKAISCSMVYYYDAPINRAFWLNFDEGRVTEVAEYETTEERAADFVISGKPEAWKSVLLKETKAATAMATGKLKVKGKQTFLLRNMNAFSRIIEVMSELDPKYD